LIVISSESPIALSSERRFSSARNDNFHGSESAAGRGDSWKGKEMCAPCHFHCGHNGDWYNFPVNPRYCRLAA
jgi:hypothetical protein